MVTLCMLFKQLQAEHLEHVIAISHKLDTCAKLPGTFTLYTVPGPMHKFLPSFLPWHDACKIMC